MDKSKRRNINKHKAVIDCYNFFVDDKVDSVLDIPDHVLKTLIFTPYFILVWFPALYRRIYAKYGRTYIENEFKIKEYEAKRICKSYKIR